MKRFVYLLICSLAFACSPLPGFSQGDDHETTTEVNMNVEDVNVSETPQYAQAIPAPEPVTVEISAADEVEEIGALASFWEWVKINWSLALFSLLGIIEIIVSLTPTEKDNAWFKWLRDFLQGILPNRKSGGGSHLPDPKIKAGGV